MMIVAIQEFRDKTTAKTIEDMELIQKGTLIQCDSKLALERIESGLAIEVLNPEILIPVVAPEEGKPEEGKPEEGKPEEGKPEEGKPEEGKPNKNKDK